MITYKSAAEIKVITKAAAILHQVLQSTLKKIEKGMTTAEIDQWIEEQIKQMGGEPGFKKVKGYHWASCISINEYVVHTPPSDRVVQDGDVITVDTGVYLGGWHTDAAWTILVGQSNPEVSRFLKIGEEAVYRGIKAAKNGARVGDISQAIQQTIEPAGYSIVKELTGHGIGKELHEDPTIPCYLDSPIANTPKIKEGMTLAIEVMYAMGSGKIVHGDDGWSIKMADGSLSASFEHTVLITKDKTIILTK